MKENKKNTINIVLNIVIILLSVVLVIFSAFYINKNINLTKSGIDVRYLGVNDASTEEPIDISLITNTFSNGEYVLTLQEDGIYSLNGAAEKSSPYTFSGGYIYKAGQDVLDVISKSDIYKAGLNPYKINMDNLFIIKADYGEHNIPGGTEYYNKEIHDYSDPSFYFLVYFKRSNDKIYTSVHPLTDLSTVSFENSYF